VRSRLRSRRDKKLITVLFAEGVSLPSHTFRALFALARSLNDHERMLQFYDAQKTMGYPFDERLLTSALSAAIKRNKPEKALSIQAEAKALGFALTFPLSPYCFSYSCHRFHRDPVFLKVALEGSIQLRQWDRVEALYEEMLKLGQVMFRPWYRLVISELFERMDEKELPQFLQKLFALEDQALTAANAEGQQRQLKHSQPHDDDFGEELDDAEDVPQQQTKENEKGIM
jgi:hypothetical protein